MELKDKQAEKYLEEAELSMKAGESLFDLDDEDLYAHVVKNCYDSMEQAVSAALAKKDLIIPKEHPAKITEFINSYVLEDKIKNILLFWLRKRSLSQYVDIKDGEIIVPHEIFEKKDAIKALEDCEFILMKIKKMIERRV